MSDDGSHQDIWLFNYKGPGSLEVEHEDNAQGFIGDIEDALIEVLAAWLVQTALQQRHEWRRHFLDQRTIKLRVWLGMFHLAHIQVT